MKKPGPRVEYELEAEYKPGGRGRVSLLVNEWYGSKGQHFHRYVDSYANIYGADEECACGVMHLSLGEGMDCAMERVMRKVVLKQAKTEEFERLAKERGIKYG